MSVRVGVVGTGMIGRDHVRRLTASVAGAQVVAVSDVDTDRAHEVAAQAVQVARATRAASAAQAAHPPRVLPTGADVVADPEVDAVLVASWGASHEEYVLASIEAGKPVFCEKPLAESPEACLRIVKAEVAAGRRLVQVGFMRRYDPAFRAMKAVVDACTVGTPLIMHCAHRNASVPAHYTRDMAILDTAVHEVDVARWLFGEEIVATRVVVPRRNRHGGALQDPLILLAELASGAVADVEISVNIRYGYDIRAEVVGEDGTVSLADGAAVTVRCRGGSTAPVAADWRTRFAVAYDVELREWVGDVAAGREPSGPGAWDGYAAQAVCEAALASLDGGGRSAVRLADRPGLYDR